MCRTSGARPPYTPRTQRLRAGLFFCRAYGAGGVSHPNGSLRSGSCATFRRQNKPAATDPVIIVRKRAWHVDPHARSRSRAHVGRKTSLARGGKIRAEALHAVETISVADALVLVDSQTRVGRKQRPLGRARYSSSRFALAI